MLRVPHVRYNTETHIQQKDVNVDDIQHVDLSYIETLSTNYMTNIIYTNKGKKSFDRLQKLEITTEDPCWTLRQILKLQFPCLIEIFCKGKISGCCIDAFYTFTQNFVKNNILPWVQYGIRKCYPYLDKNVVKLICGVLLKSADYETWFSPTERNKQINKKKKN
jgi:hypothetical protein